MSLSIVTLNTMLWSWSFRNKVPYCWKKLLIIHYLWPKRLKTLPFGAARTFISLVQSLNSPFFPPLIGAEPGGGKRRGIAHAQNAAIFPPISGGKPYLEVRFRFGLCCDNLVPRSLVDEAEGEIWPNPFCITWSPVRNVTGEATAHAQHKFGAVKAKADQGRFCKGQGQGQVKAKGQDFAKADFVAYNKLTTGLRNDLGIFARISKFPCFHEIKQTQNEVERFFLQLGRICFRILWRQ